MNDAEKLKEIKEYIQSILDIDGRYNDQFESGQQSIAAQVEEILEK